MQTRVQPTCKWAKPSLHMDALPINQKEGNYNGVAVYPYKYSSEKEYSRMLT